MIKFQNLQAINAPFEAEFKAVFTTFLNKGHYILGKGVQAFEKQFAAYCGVKHSIGVANGLEALRLIFEAYIALGKLKKGDAVIVPANTFIASILAVKQAGLQPILVDPDPKTFNISTNKINAEITSEVKAILAVHLYGQLANMEALSHVAKLNGLLLVEDAAQAHGAINKDGGKAGSLADAAAFSFYPSKNLGALGDGGAITTNSDALNTQLRLLRNYGSISKYKHDCVGFNSRLDELQALFLTLKLKHLDHCNAQQRKIAKTYIEGIATNNIILPYFNGSKNHVFHQFVVQVEHREHFITYMTKNGIETHIHYPIPPHKQKALKEFNHLNLPITESIHKHCVSLPINSSLTSLEIQTIINVVNAY